MSDEQANRIRALLARGCFFPEGRTLANLMLQTIFYFRTDQIPAKYCHIQSNLLRTSLQRFRQGWIQCFLIIGPMNGSHHFRICMLLSGYQNGAASRIG